MRSGNSLRLRLAGLRGQAEAAARIVGGIVATVAEMTTGGVVEIRTMTLVAAGTMGDRIPAEAAIIGKVIKAPAVRTATESIGTVERGASTEMFVMSIISASGSGTDEREAAAGTTGITAILTGINRRVPTVVGGKDAS